MGQFFHRSARLFKPNPSLKENLTESYKNKEKSEALEPTGS